MHCEDGDIKSLVEETSGRVEMCINKRWATVHYDEYISFYGYARSDYDSPAATVACRQLGYASGKCRILKMTYLHIAMANIAYKF